MYGCYDDKPYYNILLDDKAGVIPEELGIILKEFKNHSLVAEVSKVKQRGVDFPCEDCGALEGSVLDNGWYRCNKCGYPGK